MRINRTKVLQVCLKTVLVTFYKNSINECDLSKICVDVCQHGTLPVSNIYTYNVQEDLTSGERYRVIWLSGHLIKGIHQSFQVDS